LTELNETAFAVRLRRFERYRGLSRVYIPDHVNFGVNKQVVDCAELSHGAADWREMAIVVDYMTSESVTAFVGLPPDRMMSAPDEFEACDVLVHERCLRGIAHVNVAFDMMEPMIEACLDNGYSTTGRVLYLLNLQDEEVLDVDICVEVVEGSLNDGLFSRLTSWITGR
jgi:hypothetical protein